MTTFPTAEEYVRAVQRTDSFLSDELRRAEFVTHPVFRIPTPASGRTAVVFQARLDGRLQALRFFTRPDASTGARYAALHEHFVARDLLDHVAVPQWIDDAIRVNDRTWPVIRMQWVEGRGLNRHVDALIEQRDRSALVRLADDWRALVGRLQSSEFAHGDLQHGNVLVDGRGAMRLVDFDSAWTGRLGDAEPDETGHPNYQLENRPWGRWMDTFPGLVVYTSLVALSKNPLPWTALNNGENMLFRREDFVSPPGTPAWWHMASIRDSELDLLVARLQECCTPGWRPEGALEDVLAPRVLPWWERVDPPRRVGPEPSPVPPPPVTPPPSPPPTSAGTSDWWAAPGEPAGTPSGGPSSSAVLLGVLAGFLAAVLTAGLLAPLGNGAPLVGVVLGILVGVLVARRLGRGG